MTTKTASSIYVQEAAMDIPAIVAAAQARKTRRPLVRIFKKGN
jgi:hypothetical protein